MPLFSPMGMPIVFVRGEATLVQCLISLAISIIFLPIITLFAAKLYERSILMTGKKVKIFQALKNKK
jgi:ABC-2 type transport system permease protein